MFATFCDVVCKCTSYSWFDNDVQLGKADLSGMQIQNHAHRGFDNFVLDRICLRFDPYIRALNPDDIYMYLNTKNTFFKIKLISMYIIMWTWVFVSL